MSASKCLILTATALTVFKLSGYLTCSWWVVTLPIWLPYGALLLLTIALLAIAVLTLALFLAFGK